jgi:hypothetical protein
MLHPTDIEKIIFVILNPLAHPSFYTDKSGYLVALSGIRVIVVMLGDRYT